MAATCTTTTNGRPQRKQLSDQLDRLDTIIDALAEALPGAVTDACKEGSRDAVKEALVEIFTNSEFRSFLARLRPEPLPAIPTPASEPNLPPRKPNHWESFKAKVAAARDAVHSAAARIKNAVMERCKAAQETVVAVGTAAGEMIPVKRILLTGLCVGLV
jgi:hypothetical protein